MPTKITRHFEDVVLCHLDLVYRMAVKLSGDPHEAEDLVQETFLRAHRAFSKFELREYGAKPWLLRILHNVFYTRCGQAKKAPSLLSDLSLDDIAAELEQGPIQSLKVGELDWDQFDEELKAAVLSLTPEYRSVIVLWALADLSYKEIAKVLDCALGTVMSRLFRARQQLGEALNDFAADHGFRPRPRVKK
ncbi:MAG: RNA polymerase sigma factor [Phycisphaerae bacterium]